MPPTRPNALGVKHAFSLRASQSKALPQPLAGRLLQQLLSTLRAALPATTALSVDVGSHKILSSLEWLTLVPNSFFLLMASPAWASPCLRRFRDHFAAPETPSVCLSGDAGMAMMMGELSIVAQRQLPS